MGRLMDKVKFAARIDAELYAKVVQFANANKRSINNALQHLAQIGLDKYFEQQNKLLKKH